MPQAPIQRVLLLTTEYPATYGGLGSHVFELSNGLARSGVEVTVWSFGPATGPARAHQGVTVVAVQPSSGEGWTQKPILDQLRSFNDDLVRQGEAESKSGRPPPQVVHCHDWFLYRAARALGDRFGVPVVATVHLLAEPADRWYGMTPLPGWAEGERELCGSVRDLITVSDAMRTLIEQVHPATQGRVTVVHNGFDPRPFQPSSFKKEEVDKLRGLLAPDGAPVVLFAGRITPQKGVLPLLESARSVLAVRPEVRFLLAGSPGHVDMAAAVSATVQRNRELRERVRILGKVSRRQLAALYQIADLAVVPSVFEPFGYAALECAAAEVPLVATAVGGLKEIVLDGETGLLVPVRPLPTGLHEVDVDALAKAQLALLSDPARAERLAKKAASRVAEVFTLERMTEGTRAVYERALAGS